MGMMKDFIMKYEDLQGEIHDDPYLAYVVEMERIQNEHILADHAILENGKRCYFSKSCQPFLNVCECK